MPAEADFQPGLCTTVHNIFDDLKAGHGGASRPGPTIVTYVSSASTCEIQAHCGRGRYCEGGIPYRPARKRVSRGVPDAEKPQPQLDLLSRVCDSTQSIAGSPEGTHRPGVIGADECAARVECRSMDHSEKGSSNIQGNSVDEVEPSARRGGKGY